MNEALPRTALVNRRAYTLHCAPLYTDARCATRGGGVWKCYDSSRRTRHWLDMIAFEATQPFILVAARRPWHSMHALFSQPLLSKLPAGKEPSRPPAQPAGRFLFPPASAARLPAGLGDDATPLIFWTITTRTSLACLWTPWDTLVSCPTVGLLAP